MSSKHSTCSVLCRVLVGGASALFFSAHPILAQAQTLPTAEVAAITSTDLPDAPGMSSSSASASDPADSSAVANDGKLAANMFSGFTGQNNVPRTAGRYDTVIFPGQFAPHLTVHDKFILGLKDSFSPISAVGWVVSAGYEQAVNGSPNYGQTGKGFAQRLGAASARATSENLFGESILAPILHEDPRYYKQGPSHNFIYRLVYAGTRPIFTRTDGGRTTLNLQSLGGNLAGSALTQAYYPQLNRGFDETMKTFGGSVGGSALGNVVSEFLPGILQAAHLKKAD